MAGEEKLYAEIAGRADDVRKYAANGCEKAQMVIDLHQMCVRHADVPTVALLGAAFDDFKRKYATLSPTA